MEIIDIKVFPVNSSQIEAIKAFMLSQKIKFELVNEEPYNADFVKMIQKGDKEFAEGKGIKMSLDEFNELCK